MRTVFIGPIAGLRSAGRAVLVSLILATMFGSSGCGSSEPSPAEAKHVVVQPSNPAPGAQPRSRTPRN
jgi:hypothetical protein